MITVTIEHKYGIETVQTEPGQLLSELIRQQAMDFSLPCSGNHTCGKCRVTASGVLSVPDEYEIKFLTAHELSQGVRLACSCRALGDCVIRLFSETSLILAWAKIPEIAKTESGTGLAVDIGTTTVVARLYERGSGQVLAEQMQENRQRRFGADVISRISACTQGGVSTQSDLIAGQLEEMASRCMACADCKKIDEAVITGNSTMLHLYEGLNPASLAVAPFAVQSFFGRDSIRKIAGAPVYLPRCVGAYVGADITCAILASGMTEKNETALLVDIGTNGEMALWQNGTLFCCSTAAGPAFEGAGLSHGMSASPGAIRAVKAEHGVISYEVIGGGKASGICGSGVLDALNVMKQQDILEESGYISADFSIGSSDVFITQQDVRQIQLAKAAICAGLLTLLQYTGIATQDVTRFYIAGGFGSSISSVSAAGIGLFPLELLPKIQFIGNGALGGAAMLLLNSSLRKKADSLAKSATELSLSESPVFMDYYINCMMF